MTQYILRLGAIFIIAAAIVARFQYSSSFAATWDQVDFALAVTDYDLFRMQPHFPGYPFFILFGMLLYPFASDAAQALSYANALLAASAVIPMYGLARRFGSATAALVTTAVLQTSVYFAVLVTQPMSEGAALSVLWWYLWSAEKAIRARERRWQLWSAALFALLMGIRLSYVPFGLALAWIWYREWRDNRTYTLGLIGAAALFQAVWAGALVWNTGGLTGFWKLSIGFVAGHFTEWGGAVTETGEPVLLRLYRLLIRNIGAVGLAGDSGMLQLLFALLFGYLLLQYRKLRVSREILWLIGVYLAYFIWNWLGQNIDKPRHSYPLAMLLLFAVSLSIARLRILLLALAAVQFITSIPLIQEQAAAAPATYQLARYLEAQPQPLIVYTWEETRVMDYLQVPYEHKRVYSYDYFLQDKKYRTHDTIYVTHHLLEGFQQQGVELADKLEQAAVFRSRDLFDPVYNEIVLYKWKDERP